MEQNDPIAARAKAFALRLQEDSSDLMDRWRRVEAETGAHTMAQMVDSANYVFFVAVGLAVRSLRRRDREDLYRSVRKEAVALLNAWRSTSDLPNQPMQKVIDIFLDSFEQTGRLPQS